MDLYVVPKVKHTWFDLVEGVYLSARVRVAGVNTGRFIAVLKYSVSDAVVNGVAMPFTTQTAKLSLCEVGGMYGVDTTIRQLPLILEQ